LLDFHTDAMPVPSLLTPSYSRTGSLDTHQRIFFRVGGGLRLLHTGEADAISYQNSQGRHNIPFHISPNNTQAGDVVVAKYLGAWQLCVVASLNQYPERVSVVSLELEVHGRG
jgi:hypothetical protein